MRGMWFIGGVALVGALYGCDMRPPEGRQVSAPGGLAPADLDVANPGAAAPAAPAAGVPAQAPNAVPPANPPAAGGPEKESLIGKNTNKVVNYNDYRNDPAWIIVENKTAGEDPLTVAASAYVSARSRASLFGMEAALKQFKIVEERVPTYDELLKIMQENRVEFTALYGWQMYAYDPMTGGILILENPQIKTERYQAAGVTP